MNALFIVHHPGKIPRIGYPMGDIAVSLKDWVRANPGATIYVIESSQPFPQAGTAGVSTAEQYLWDKGQASANLKGDETKQRLARLDAMLCAIFKRRAVVEETLLQMAAGKLPLPDAAKCRELAIQLGVPEGENFPDPPATKESAT